ncbi:MAG: hypothetical protein QOF89_1169 [Acidobacteriota bacterium]|jgi:hypothetical protein|nr:hypothetical protein [Acidobacteriota bacterium]
MTGAEGEQWSIILDRPYDRLEWWFAFLRPGGNLDPQNAYFLEPV